MTQRARHTSLLLLALACCSGDEDVTRWSEDVEITGGKVVRVERRVVRGKGAAPYGARGGIDAWELCYEPLKIYWKSAYFQPSAFELVGDKAFVKFPVLDCRSCRAADMPDDSTVYMAYRGGAWVRIGASEFPGKRWWNLMMTGIFDPRNPRLDVSGHMTLAEKKRLNWFAEDTPQGQTFMKEELSFCQRKCRHPLDAPPLKIEVEAKPHGRFCR